MRKKQLIDWHIKGEGMTEVFSSAGGQTDEGVGLRKRCGGGRGGGGPRGVLIGRRGAEGVG